MAENISGPTPVGDGFYRWTAWAELPGRGELLGLTVTTSYAGDDVRVDLSSDGLALVAPGRVLGSTSVGPPPAPTVYLIGYNRPGFLPDGDPWEVVGSWDEAKGVAIAEILNASDAAGLDGDETYAENLAAVAEDLNLDGGPEWGVTVRAGDDNLTAWWIVRSTYTPAAEVPRAGLEEMVRKLVQGLDGSYGQSWAEFATEIEEGSPEVPVYVYDRGLLASIIREVAKDLE